MATLSKASKSKGLGKTPAKKSNIKIGALKGKIKEAPDCWQEDLKSTIKAKA